MHVTDIEDCLKRKDIRGIEGAFRALVGYPKEGSNVGATGAADLSDLLARVCTALQDDTSVMPPSTIELLSEVNDNTLAVNPDYSGGAAIAH